MADELENTGVLNNAETEHANTVPEDKQPLFVNETKPDVETYLKVSMTLTKKQRIEFLLGGIALILIGFAYVFAFTYYWEKDPGFFPWIFFLLGMLILIRPLIYKPLTKKRVKEKLDGRIHVVRYAFYDDYFEFVGITDETALSNTSTVKGDYMRLVECKEYKDFILLYYDKTSYDFVMKSGMVQGDANDLTAFLLAKLGARYKVCYKRKPR